MFPDPSTLRPHRIRQKLEEGLTAAQVAVWFASPTITRTLVTEEVNILVDYVSGLHSRLVLRTEEKLDLEAYLLNNNISTAVDKLCVYLQGKSEGDVVELIEFLQETGSLTSLGAYLNILLERCRDQVNTGLCS